LRVLLEKIPFLVISIAVGLITFLIQSKGAGSELGTVAVPAKGAVADFETFTVFQHFFFASYTFVMYMIKIIFPVLLSPFYPYPGLTESGYLPLQYYLAPFAALVLFVIAFLSVRRTRVILFAFLFYTVNLILVLQFISVGSAIMADRYAYIPLWAFCFLTGYGIGRVREKAGNQGMGTWIFIGLGSFIAISFGVISTRQVKVWKNSETMWTSVIKQYPNAKIAWDYRGDYYIQTEQYKEALQDYEFLVQLGTKDAGAYSNLGNIYALLGKTEKAMLAYSYSIERDSNFFDAWLNRGITYAQMHNYTAALPDFKRALVLRPDNRDLLFNLSSLLLDMGNYIEAEKSYTKLIAIDPGNDDLYLRRGVARLNLKNKTDGQRDLQRCLELNPGNTTARQLLSK
jgi:protein O-mannosyl-transferase